MLEPFAYDFMQRAAVEGVLMGVVCGLLGTLVVLRGLTYTGESLSHTLVPGAAIALAIGTSVLLGALAAGVLTALAIAALARRPEVGEEAAVAVVFTGAFAVGVILLSRGGTSRDLDSLLFGSILAVERSDLWVGLVAALAAAGSSVALARHFILVAFDRTFAGAAGLRPGLLDAVLLVLLAGALTAALRGIGTLLVLSLLVAPAATARVLTQRIWTMLWLAPALGVAFALTGLELSYHLRVAAGPAIALSGIAVFALVTALDSLQASFRRRVPAGLATRRP